MAVTLNNSQISAGLYSAFWNRAADYTGQQHWVGLLNAGTLTPLQVATEFYNDPEGKAAYPEWIRTNPAALVTEVYQSVFERAPDAGGLAFYVNQINGGASFPQVVLNMMYNALNAGNTDGAQFANEIQVSQYVAEVLRTDDPEITGVALEGVTADPASVTVREAQLYEMANPGLTYTLTTNADIATAQYFDGSLNSFGKQTLQNFDQLTGQKAVNHLDAEIISGNDSRVVGDRAINGASSYVTPQLLANIQEVEVTVMSNPAAGYNVANTGATLDLRNADSVEVLVNDGSVASLSFNNVGGTLTDVVVANTGSDTVLNLAQNADLTEVNLTLSNVFVDPAALDVAKVVIGTAETVNITSADLANAVNLVLPAANTIVIDGDADLYARLDVATNSVSSVNAAALTGDLDLSFSAQTQTLSTTDITVVSGQGNDSIEMSAVEQDYIVTLGAGNDTLMDANITVDDSIVGGDGFDTLETTYDSAVNLTATVNGVDGIDRLVINNALTEDLNVTEVDSTITEINLAAESLGLTTRTGPKTITGSSGLFLVGLGSNREVDDEIRSDNRLRSALTITEKGQSLNDELVIVNLAVNAATDMCLNVFAGEDITSDGYENLRIISGQGTSSPADNGVHIGTLSIIADSTSADTSLTVEGNSALSIDHMHTDSTGLLTVDASSMNVKSTAYGIGISGTSQGAGGSASIIGSAGMDYVYVGNFASTILGGGGNDTIVGNDQADQLYGDSGSDSIVGGGGNDTIHGDEGDDVIDVTAPGVVSVEGGTGNDVVAVGSSLDSLDVVNGNDGVDTIVVTTENVSAANAIGVSNFEVLRTNASQTMTNFYNNSGFTTVSLFDNETHTDISISNALSKVATLELSRSLASDTHNIDFTRLVDTSNDTLKIALPNSYSANLELDSLAVVNEESLVIDNTNGDPYAFGFFNVQYLIADDLESLTVVGDQPVSVGVIRAAVPAALNLANVNASSLMGRFEADASASAVDLTFTGTYSNLFVSGSGNDVLVGGEGNDTLVGNAGKDTVSLGDDEDRYFFANLGTAAGVAATAAEISLSVGSDSISGFSSIDYDKLYLTTGVFGTAIGTDGESLDSDAFQSVVSANSLLQENQTAGVTNSIIVVQSDQKQNAHVYYIDTSINSSSQSLNYILSQGHATLIATISGINQAITNEDFIIITL